MTVESFVDSLSKEEKVYAMELLWRDLTQDQGGFNSPAWHDRVVQERLKNPMPGVALGL